MSTVTRGNRRTQVVMAEVINTEPLPTCHGLRIPSYDYASHTYSGDGAGAVESVYRVGGPVGEVVATVTRVYDAGGRLLSEQVV